MTGAALSGLAERVRDYAAHADSRVETGNKVAMLVASSQPFYPLYLWGLVGNGVGWSLLTFMSTPFFLAVPAVSRMDTRAGRALLPLAGIGNTVLCAKLFGVASAVEIFLVPCVVLALLLFRPGERAPGYILVAASALAYWLLQDRYGVPMAALTLSELAALASLNLFSAASLTACVALMFSNVLAAAERHAA